MKTIRQTATIRGAAPHDIYETIMDPKKHTKLSRQPTTVSRRVGGAFKVGHDLEGKNLKLTKDRRIVQTWRANNWPKGTYSKATFAFARDERYGEREREPSHRTRSSSIFTGAPFAYVTRTPSP